MNELKVRVAKKALDFIDSNIILGVGSGSTVRYFIHLLSESLKHGSLGNIIAIPTSVDTLLELKSLGIQIGDFNQYPEIDIAIDGADSILLDTGVYIKGGGGAFFREKMIDYRAKKLIIIVDESKINRNVPIPVEVEPFSLVACLNDLSKLGKPRIRESRTKLGPTISDHGNVIIDLIVNPLSNITKELEIKINSIPGVIENGIFSKKAKILIGMKNETKEIDL